MPQSCRRAGPGARRRRARHLRSRRGGRDRDARDQLGPEAVWVLGEDEVDLPAVLDRLGLEGRRRILCEGGPRLHGSLLAADLVDELALTTVSRLVGGDGPRIAGTGRIDRSMELRHLVAAGSTMLHLYARTHDGRDG